MSFFGFRRVRMWKPLLMAVVALAAGPSCIRAKPAEGLEKLLYEQNLALPAITSIETKSILLGTAEASIDVCLDGFTPGQALTWTAASSNPALLPSNRISLSSIDTSGPCPRIGVSLTPTENTVGITTITLSWTDPYKSTSTTFRFSVLPRIEESLTEDGAVITELASGYTIAGSHPAFSTILAPGSSSGAGQFTLSSSGIATFQPDADFHGSDSLVYSISMEVNGVTETIEGEVQYTIASVDDAPSAIALSSTSLAENSGANVVVGTLSTTDVDAGDTHSYSVVSGVGDFTSFSIGGAGANELRITPSADYETKSSYTVSVRATDSGLLTFTRSFTITINNVVEAPVLSYSSSTHSWNRGAAITSITASFASGKDAATSCGSTPALPSGVSLSSLCTISGTPTLASSSTIYTITASNSAGSSQATLDITVLDTPPALSFSPTTLSTEEDVTITPWSSSNSGGDVTACSSTPALPTGLSVAASSGNCAITGAPTTPGTQTVTITGSNLGGSSTATLTIAVTATDPRTIFLATANCNDSMAVIGSRAVPFCSAQAAVNAAIAASPSAESPVTIQVGSKASGNFGNVTLTQNFGAHVTWKGVSTTASRIGDVTASGASGAPGSSGWTTYQQLDGMPQCGATPASSNPSTPGSPGENGHSLTLTSDGTVRFGTISASGGSGGIGASAFSDTCMNTIAASAAGPGGNGGSITLERVTAESVVANAGVPGEHAPVQSNADSMSGVAAGQAGQVSLNLSTVLGEVQVRGANGRSPPGSNIVAGSGSAGGALSLEQSWTGGTCDTSAGSDGTGTSTSQGTCYSGGKILVSGGGGCTGYNTLGSLSCASGTGPEGRLCNASSAASLQISGSPSAIDLATSFYASGGISGLYSWSTIPENWGSFWPENPTGNSVTWNHGTDPGRRVTLQVADLECPNLTPATTSFGTNSPPTLTQIAPIIAPEGSTSVTITHSLLSLAANEADVETSPLSFRIESVSTGNLTKNGMAITAGSTLISSNDSVVWTPAGGTTGQVAAFSVVAWDGSLASATPVNVRIQIGTSPGDDPDSMVIGAPRTIYLAVEGCDNSRGGIGVLSPAFCSAQAAVNAAIAATPSAENPLRIQVGTGSFGDVTLSQSFGTYVTWKGNGLVNSFIGTIDASGTPGVNGVNASNPWSSDWGTNDCSNSGYPAGNGTDGGNGYSLTLTSDNSVSFGNIVSSGGAGGNGGNGAGFAPSCSGGFNSPGIGAPGGNAGTIVLDGITAAAVLANGGNGGNGGQDGLNPQTLGAAGIPGQAAGIIATHSNLITTSSNGGSSGGAGVAGKPGGAITLDSTVVSADCRVEAGSNDDPGSCPAGGTISLYHTTRTSSCGTTHVAGASGGYCEFLDYGSDGVVCNDSDVLSILNAGILSSTSATLTASGGSSGLISWGTSAGGSFSPNPGFSTELSFSSAQTADVTVEASDLRCGMHFTSVVLGFAPPTLSTIDGLSGAMPATAFTITHEMLADAADEADSVSSPVLFRIEEVLSGSLMQDGSAVTPGQTVIAPEQPVVWTSSWGSGTGLISAFRVSAWDGLQPSSASVAVQIQVIAPPSNLGPSQVQLSASSIAENGGPNLAVGTLSTTDANVEDTHTYELVDGFDDNASFSISGNTLYLLESADYEAKSSYSVRIRSTDSGAPELSHDEDFTLSVTDVDENADDPRTVYLAMSGCHDGSAVIGDSTPPFCTAQAAVDAAIAANPTSGSRVTISVGVITAEDAGNVVLDENFGQYVDWVGISTADSRIGNIIAIGAIGANGTDGTAPVYDGEMMSCTNTPPMISAGNGGAGSNGSSIWIHSNGLIRFGDIDASGGDGGYGGSGAGDNYCGVVNGGSGGSGGSAGSVTLVNVIAGEVRANGGTGGNGGWTPGSSETSTGSSGSAGSITATNSTLSTASANGGSGLGSRPGGGITLNHSVVLGECSAVGAGTDYDNICGTGGIISYNHSESITSSCTSGAAVSSNGATSCSTMTYANSGNGAVCDSSASLSSAMIDYTGSLYSLSVSGGSSGYYYSNTSGTGGFSCSTGCGTGDTTLSTTIEYTDYYSGDCDTITVGDYLCSNIEPVEVTLSTYCGP